MGIARRLESIQLSRDGLGEPVGDNDLVYKRWYDRFLIIFGVIAVLSIIAAVADSSVPLEPRLAGAALTVGLMIWFHWRGRWDQVTSDRHLIIFMLGMLLGVIVSIRLWDGFALQLFGAYWLGFAYFRLWAALVYVTLLTIGSQWAFGAFDDVAWNLDIVSPTIVIIMLLALVVSGMMASYIESFARESDRRAQLLEELQAAQAELAEQERAAGMRQERERMAAEIHDTIAQHFTSIVTNLTAAENRIDSNPAASQHHLESALDAARQGITDARRMVRTLQPEVLADRTLTEALREISASAGSAHGLDVRFDETGLPAPMNRIHEAILVRALQETLLNVRKHAGANTVTVSLAWEDDDMILDITDDGAGFDPGLVQPTSEGHQMGLATMRSRVESAGGTWMLESAPGEGTSLAISFPVEPDRERAAQ